MKAKNFTFTPSVFYCLETKKLGTVPLSLLDIFCCTGALEQLNTTDLAPGSKRVGDSGSSVLWQNHQQLRLRAAMFVLADCLTD